ncbi:hypothetical protein D3C86_1443230 [compost metagenome]
MADDGLAGEGVGLDLDRLAQAHAADLGLLEVGDDIGVLQGDDGHHLSAGLDHLADADAAGADDPGDGGADDGAVERQLGLFDQGARLFDGGDALVAGRAEHGGGALFGGQGGLGLGDRGAGGLGGGALGLDALLRHPALGGQLAVAIDLGAGQTGLGLGLGHGGGAGGDVGLFLFGAGVDIGHGGGQGGQIGLGLGQGRARVGVVQTGQDLTGLDALVVLDQDLDHRAADARADQDGVGLDEGVVGRLPALLALPPDDAPDDEADDDDPADDQGQAFLESGGEGHGETARFDFVA